jgi:N-methylhydantoinase A/oxoprolinase/acetone carboxylase beta subunit
VLAEGMRLVADGCSAIAVCFLHSYANPAHEQAAGRILREAFPTVSISLSSEVAPEIREYERLATTCANAFVQPLMDRYIGRLLRELVFEVPERVRADGSVQTPLDEDAARAVADRLAALGVEAVAVVFLHAYRNAEHEARMGELLAEALPGAYVTLSHDVSREYREYVRTSTVAANAFVGPVVSDYLQRLERRMQDEGAAASIRRSPTPRWCWGICRVRASCSAACASTAMQPMRRSRRSGIASTSIRAPPPPASWRSGRQRWPTPCVR